MIWLVAVSLAFAVAIAICALVINLFTWRITMKKLDVIIAEERQALDAIKALRAADAAKTDAMATQIADLKNQLADVATPDQLAALQAVADDLKAIGTDPAAPPATPPDAPPAPPADPPAQAPQS